MKSEGDTSEFVPLRLGSRIPKQGAASLTAISLGAFPSAYGAVRSGFCELPQISSQRAIWGRRASVSPVWKLTSLAAWQLAAPCFGFVDASRSVLIHTQRQ